MTVKAEARRFNVLAAGRRWGKNTLGEELVTDIVLDGAPVGWFSPTYKTLADDWRMLTTLLLPVTRDKNEQERRIELISRGTVEMWSLETPDSSRGRLYRRIIVDEAATATTLAYAWPNVMRPMLTDYEGDAWFISTPKGRNYFWQLHEQGRDAAFPDWQSWRRPSSENPFLSRADLEQARHELASPVFKQEYEAEFSTFAGQFFTEWAEAVHLCPAFDVPKHWRQYGMLDYGFANPFCYLQEALSPDGQGFLHRELYQSRVMDTDQAVMIANACREQPPEYIIAGPDLWHPSGKGPKGQSSAETYQQVWRQMSPPFVTRLLRADDARTAGWSRCREWLRPYPGANGQMTAHQQVMVGRCPNFVRTVTGLVHDEHNVEDLDTTGEDHAADAWRYGKMSRPEPARPKPKPTSPFDIDIQKILKERARKYRYPKQPVYS